MAKNKKDDILQAACDLFFENGYDNTSMKMIAKKAGVVQSHTYLFFETKEVLLTEVIHYALSENYAVINELLKNSMELSPEEFTDKCFEAFATMREKATFIMHCALTPKLSGKVKEILQEYNTGLAPMLEPIFAGQEPEKIKIAAYLLTSLSDSYFLDNDEETARSAFREVLRIYKK